MKTRKGKRRRRNFNKRNETQSVKDKKSKNKRKATLVNLDEANDTNFTATKKTKIGKRK